MFDRLTGGYQLIYPRFWVPTLRCHTSAIIRQAFLKQIKNPIPPRSDRYPRLSTDIHRYPFNSSMPYAFFRLSLSFQTPRASHFVGYRPLMKMKCRAKMKGLQHHLTVSRQQALMIDRATRFQGVGFPVQSVLEPARSKMWRSQYGTTGVIFNPAQLNNRDSL